MRRGRNELCRLAVTLLEGSGEHLLQDLDGVVAQGGGADRLTEFRDRSKRSSRCLASARINAASVAASSSGTWPRSGGGGVCKCAVISA